MINPDIALNEDSQLKKDLMVILRELIDNVSEVKSRKEQPNFNKGLDIYIDYSVAIRKIIERVNREL